MNLPWLRLYSRMIDDDKMRLLAFEDRWHFVALLCLKREGILEERDPSLRSRKMAVKMGLQVRELDEVCRRLSEVGLTDSLGNPTKWDDLQFESDSSTQRVRKYREKQKKHAKKRECNVSVTGQDTDTDTDKELKPSVEATDRPPDSDPPGQPEKSRRFVAAHVDLPDEINPDAWREWCEFRSAKRKPVSEAAARKQLKLLCRYPKPVQQTIVDTSIQNDYQGLFEPKGGEHADTGRNHGSGQDARRLSPAERIRAARREAGQRHAKSP